MKDQPQGASMIVKLSILWHIAVHQTRENED